MYARKALEHFFNFFFGYQGESKISQSEHLHVLDLQSDMNILPLHLIVVYLVPMLALKDLVKVETAYVRRWSQWKAVLQKAKPLELDAYLQKSVFVLARLFELGLTIKRIQIDANEHGLQKILIQNHGSVREIDLCIRNNIPSNELLAKCFNLKIVGNLSPEVADAVCMHAVHLTSFDLAIDATEESEALALSILSANTNLQSLSMKVNTLSAPLIAAIKAVGSGLTKLSLVIKLFDYYKLCEITASCPKLTHLTIDGIDARFEQFVEHGDSWLALLAEHCPLLEHLRAERYRFTTRGIEFLLKRCRHLRNIRSISTFDDPVTLKAYATHDAPLEELHLKYPLEGKLASYQQLFSHTTILLLDGDCIDFKTTPGAVRYMCALQELILSGTSSASTPGRGYGCVLNAVALHCPHLQRLIFWSSVPKRGDAAFEAGLWAVLAHCKALNTLWMLTIPIGDLSDTVVEALALHGQSLKDLTISTYTVADAQMIKMASAFTAMTHLGLLSPSDLTDATMFSLAQHCRQLQSASLIHCRNITIAGLAQLVHCCRKLNKLQVSTAAISEGEDATLSSVGGRLYPLAVVRT